MKLDKKWRVFLVATVITLLMGTVSARNLDYALNDTASPIEDYSGNDLDGTPNGNLPNAVNGFFGDAQGFDGSGDWINSPTTNLFDSGGADPFSVSAWVYSRGSDSGREVILAPSSQADIQFNSEGGPTFNNGAWGLRAYDGSNFVVQGSDLGTGKWFHLVVTYDGSTIKLYNNATEVASKSWSGVSNSKSTSGDAIGRYASDTSSSLSDNKIDEFKVFSQALTGSEITNLKNCNQITSCNTGPSIDSKDYNPDNPNKRDSIDIFVNASDTNGDDLTATASVWRGNTKINDSVSMSEPTSNEFEILGFFSADEEKHYTIQYEVSDGQETTKSNQTFTISDTKPEFKIVKPENKVYGNSTVDWKVKTNSTDDILNEDIDLEIQSDGATKDTRNITEGDTATGSFSESEGNHTLKAIATEQDGTSRSKKTFYEIDTTPPKINITDPQGPTDSLTNLPLNFTVSDSNLDSSTCSYTKDGGSNFSISNCDNTTIDFGKTGNHSLRVYADDTVGNTGADLFETFIDNRNEVRIEDASSNSQINNFSVTLDNGTKSIGGSTTDGQFEFYTSKMPLGSVNMTLKSDGYQTKTVSFSNVDRGFTLDKKYSLERAGIVIKSKNEISENRLDFNFTATNQTTTFTKNNISSFSEDFKNFDSIGFPTGDVKVTVEQVDGNFKPRTYLIDVNKNTKINLVAYLLEKGEGIYITVEVRKPNNDKLKGALVNIHRKYGTAFKTVTQAKTKSDGTTSFYLSPDTSYKAIATHPDYESFSGTFSPVNYQYDPLIIQLGEKSNFTETTTWGEVEYQLTPKKQALNSTGVYQFNWTVIDSSGGLSEFGIRIKNETGAVLNSTSVSGTPSGGTVSTTFNISNSSSIDAGEELIANGYFVKDQKEFNYERTYNVLNRVKAGIYSIKKIMAGFESGSSDTSQSLLALIFTLAIGTGLKSKFNRAGGGLVTLLILGWFTLQGWFNGFFLIMTALGLIGLYGRRG